MGLIIYLPIHSYFFYNLFHMIHHQTIKHHHNLTSL